MFFMPVPLILLRAKPVEAHPSNRSFGLRLILVCALTIIIILRLAFHIVLSFLLPLLIVLAILFVGLVLGARMFKSGG
jgi:uncharacterized membrane protein